MSTRILFVDDDAFIRKIYTDRLHASGFEVDTGASVGDAKALLETNEYDLVCLDYLLGAETGLDVLKWIRTEKQLDVPVVIFSASGQESEIAAFTEAGATEYIQKDHVVPSELLKKFDEILQRHKK